MGELRTADGQDVSLHRLGPLERERPALILVHGFIQNRRAFDVPGRSVPLFLAERGYTVYTLDLRGRAGTTPAKWSLRHYAEEDAATAVLFIGELHRQLAWVGHSMGGLVGLSLEPAVASRLSAIVCLGSPLRPGPKRLQRLGLHRLLLLTARTLHQRGAVFRGTRYSGALSLIRRALDDERMPFPLRLWAPGSLEDAALAWTLREGFADDGWGVFGDLLELIVSDGEWAGGVPIGERLRALKTPLLVIAGDADHLAPPDGVRPIFERAGSTHKRYVEVGRKSAGRSFGHIDLIVGTHAPAFVWSEISLFVDEQMRR